MKTCLFLLKATLLAVTFALLGDSLDVAGLNSPVDDLGQALRSVDETFRQDLRELDQQIADYLTLASDNRADVVALREQHLTVRRAYKKVEFLLAYAQPATVTRHLNGAPLPKTEPGVPEIVVKEPGGLQTLDELVFAPEIDRAAVKKLTNDLLGDYRRLARQMSGLRLQHRHVFESANQQLIRLFTLGVTGFDTPASGAALAETRTSWQTLSTVYRSYETAVAAIDPASNQKVLAAFAAGEKALQTDDFDQFDRLSFLRSAINPLTAALPRIQARLGIESAADVKNLPAPVNAEAEYLFDADYLNADYFANLPEVSTEQERVALGRMLFFDPALSKDFNTSCASCHKPELAFTDGYPRSLRSDGSGTVLRNSPTLVNSVYAEKYFYDLREEFLERQVKHVVMDRHEFATDFVTLQERLARSDEYQRLFTEAYSQEPKYRLSRWSISDALARYLASLQGNNSTFDRYARGETAQIDEEVRRGFNLFMGKAACGTCHFAPTFSGLVPPYYQESESEVLGVPDSARWTNARVDPDLGRIANSRPTDEVYFNAYAFKTPTIRNASVTAPYMHNGVYKSLEEVMDFYNRGGGAGIGIDLEHQTLPPAPLGLEEDEINAIIAFMHSLEDYRHLNEKPTNLPEFADHPEWNEARRAALLK